MESPRVAFLLILLFLIFLTPDPPARRHLQIAVDLVEAQRQTELDTLFNSSYGQLNPDTDSWLNLTGFRRDDGYQWGMLALARNLSIHQRESAWHGTEKDTTWHDTGGTDRLPIYDRVTGEIRGPFLNQKRAGFGPGTAPGRAVNLTVLDPKRDYLVRTFERNVSEAAGEISLSIYDAHDRRPHEASPVKADVSISTDSSPGNGWQANVHGVHLTSGHILMTTSSSKFDSLAALPQFALAAQDFNATIPVMNGTMHRKWERTMEDLSDGLLFAPQCELIVWLQPLPHVFPGLNAADTHDYLHRVEEELVRPEGAPIGTPPPLAFSAVVFSPDCGYILEATALYGPKAETYWSLAQRLLFSFVMVMGLQIALLKRQMERAATPSTRSRVAYQSIVVAALGDGLILFALIALLMIDEAAFLIVAAASFLSCIHVAFLEVKFIFDIWTVQVADPARAENERQRRVAQNTPPPSRTPAPVPPATGQDEADPSAAPSAPAPPPAPASAPRPDGAMPIIIAPDQDTLIPPELPGARASFAAIYSRFYFSLVILMFFSLWAMSWPRPLRSAYANLLAFCYFSLWWPQIHRNTMRNCRKALGWEYVVGSSLLRAVPVLYWYFAPHNILAVDTSPATALLLLGWLWLQVVVLASQQLLGPRLLVPDSWCPPAYDYYPVLRDDDVEANGMSIGLLASASEAKDKDDKTRKVFDCAICMNEIDVPVLSRYDGGGGRATGTAWLERSTYMVTPCRHIFHAACLEGWMNLRLVCPVCREELPPL